MKECEEHGDCDGDRKCIEYTATYTINDDERSETGKVCIIESTMNCGDDETDPGEITMVSNGVGMKIKADCEGFDKEIIE